MTPTFRVHAEPWIAFQPALDAMLEPLGRSVMARLAPASGERILDVGCGCGATTLALARMVGPSGRVTGIDPSASMLTVAGLPPLRDWTTWSSSRAMRAPIRTDPPPMT